MTQMYNPAHPGAVLRHALSEISIAEAARRLGVPRATLSRILSKSASVTPDMDLRLSKALGTSSGIWYQMQADYDMWQARRRFKAKVKPIKSTLPPEAA